MVRGFSHAWQLATPSAASRYSVMHARQKACPHPAATPSCGIKLLMGKFFEFSDCLVREQLISCAVAGLIYKPANQPIKPTSASIIHQIE